MKHAWNAMLKIVKEVSGGSATDLQIDFTPSAQLEVCPHTFTGVDLMELPVQQCGTYHAEGSHPSNCLGTGAVIVAQPI